MSFRTRISLVAAAAVAVAVVVASLVVYFVVRGQLLGQVDTSLRRSAAITLAGPGLRIVNHDLEVPGVPFGEAFEYMQAVPPRGVPVTRFNLKPLPVSDRAREAAQGSGRPFFSNVFSGVEWRVFTVPGPPYALQIARPLTEVNHTLHRLAVFLLLIAAGGVAVAAGLGLAVSKTALGPVRRLTSATENVTETGDLSQRIDAEGRDELSRLAASFNTMLGALEESTSSQRRLVADASHELRTPLTSLRTNIEVLASEPSLADEERKRLLHDVVEQLGEMTTLIGELIELARGQQQPADAEDVRLDLVTASAVERARRDRAGITFKTDFEESLVHGIPASIERAVANLLDNAAKWSPPVGEVDVSVHDGTVTVRDHGPGIDEEDLPFVFDRFYRARSARRLPGSGLGLAIVKQVAEAHGGSVVAERAEGGGTRMVLRLDHS
jgi:two-component system sensor histidine kinase MprB